MVCYPDVTVFYHFADSIGMFHLLQPGPLQFAERYSPGIDRTPVLGAGNGNMIPEFSGDCPWLAQTRFKTARTRQFRTGVLNEEDEGTIRNIEKFGCSVVSVKSDAGRASGWTYTIGVFDTSGMPDLVTVGLREWLTRA